MPSATTSNPTSPRSPNRSPRMSGLLLALQDVIGPTLDDEYEDSEDQPVDDSLTDELKAFDTSHTNSHTLVSSRSQSLVDSRNRAGNRSPHSDDSGNATEEEEEDVPVIFSSEDYNSNSEVDDDDDQTTISLGTVRRLTVPFPQADPTEEGEEEIPTAELPSSLVPADAVEPPQPQPRNQSPTSLLSPVDMSITPLLPSLYTREDSIDSGYAEGNDKSGSGSSGWFGPLRLSASPPSRRRSRKLTGEISFAVGSPLGVGGGGGDSFSEQVESMFSPQRRTASPSPLSHHSLPLNASPSSSPLSLPSSTNPSHLTPTDEDVRKAINRQSQSPLRLLPSSTTASPDDEKDRDENPPFEDTEPLGPQSSLVDALRSLQSVVDEQEREREHDPPMPPGPTSHTVPSPSPRSRSRRRSRSRSGTRRSPVDGLASAKRKWGAVIGELSMLSLDIQPPLSTAEAGGSGDDGDRESSTRLLAFSPKAEPTRGRGSSTLDSVYGCYSMDDTEGEGESSGPSTSASTSSTSTSLMSAATLSPTSTSTSPDSSSLPTAADCEQMFIAPPPPPPAPPPPTPPRGRTSTTIIRSVSSPSPTTNTSIPALFVGTPKDKRKAKGKEKAPAGLNVEVDISSWDEAMDAGAVSTKVGFGFRYPHSLGRGRPGSSSARISHSLRVSTDLDDLRRKSLLRTPSKDLSPRSSYSSSPSPSPGLRPLKLPSALSSRSRSRSPSISISSSLSRISNHNDPMQNLSTPQSPSVSSDHSLSNNRLLSSARSSPLIPQHIRNTLVPANDISPLILAWDRTHPPHPPHPPPPLSAPVPQHSRSWQTSPMRAITGRASSRNVTTSPLDRHYPRPSSRLSEPAGGGQENLGPDDDNNTIRNTLSSISPHSAHITRSASAVPSPMHAIATPPPTLLFAIASDDVAQVIRVLESGDAGPNDQVGPQSALAFTLTNDGLRHKMEIVKVLLAFGADPSVLKDPELNPPRRHVGLGDDAPHTTLLEGMDPATRYYIARAESPSTRRISQLMQRSFFRPLTRLLYDLVGQDCALDQLFRVLSMHSQQISVSPMVILLCGPSGHGKSMLARRFGSLLNVPTHTVNMTTLRSTHDLWKCFSMSPYEEPSDMTLTQFLMHNEGKRCVVVLDEIEKTEDEKALWSLLMPWELGRCSPEAGKRHIDVRNVIWLGTSNIGEDLVFDYNASRLDPDAVTTRDEYVELMGLLRPRVSARLGASLLSRVTTVLPFVPFSQDEKMAITAEALHSLAGERVMTMSPQDMESLVARALPSYLPLEGARSLCRVLRNIADVSCCINNGFLCKNTAVTPRRNLIIGDCR